MEIIFWLMLVLVGLVGMVVMHYLALVVALIFARIWDDPDEDPWLIVAKEDHFIKFSTCSWAEKTCFFRLRIGCWEWTF